MSCTNYIIITCSRLHRYPVYAAQIQIAAVDYEMQKDMPLKCDAAGEIMCKYLFCSFFYKTTLTTMKKHIVNINQQLTFSN